MPSLFARLLANIIGGQPFSFAGDGVSGLLTPVTR